MQSWNKLVSTTMNILNILNILNDKPSQRGPVGRLGYQDSMKNKPLITI